jgi:membrane-bound lytic murein transglycosylase MltF
LRGKRSDRADSDEVARAFRDDVGRDYEMMSLRREAEAEKLDPNVWFNNVERVAAARVGQEPVRYVRNIYKYYAAPIS